MQLTALLPVLVSAFTAAEWPPAECDYLYIPRTNVGSTDTSPVYLPDTGSSGAASVRYPSVFGATVPLLRCATKDDAMNSSKPQILLFGEWFGLSNATVSAALQMVQRGFVVYIANTYRDHDLPVDSAFTSVDAVTAASTASAYKMANLNWGTIVNDVADVIANLTTGHPKKSTSLMGFSEGSAIALLASQDARSEGIDATVAFYGSPGKYCGNASAIFHPSQVDVPVFLACGELDTFTGFSSCDTLKPLKEEFASVKQSEFVEYPKVGHGFLNDQKWWASWKAAQTPPRDPYSPETTSTAFDHAAMFLQAAASQHHI